MRHIALNARIVLPDLVQISHEFWGKKFYEKTLTDKLDSPLWVSPVKHLTSEYCSEYALTQHNVRLFLLLYFIVSGKN